MWPLHVPRPEVPESLPVPEANLSWTVTDARTEPDFTTYPLNHEIGMGHNAVGNIDGEVVTGIA